MNTPKRKEKTTDGLIFSITFYISIFLSIISFIVSGLGLGFHYTNGINLTMFITGISVLAASLTIFVALGIKQMNIKSDSLRRIHFLSL